MATSAPPSILMPALPSDCPSLQGDSRHFISRREFEVWSRTHPSVRPQTVPTASTSTSSSAPATTASTASATTNTSSSSRPNGIGTDTPGYSDSASSLRPTTASAACHCYYRTGFYDQGVPSGVSAVPDAGMLRCRRLPFAGGACSERFARASPMIAGPRSAIRAPQHPVSHLLQSIPPRAPSRSSRSKILSYTVHLATSSRLEAYTLPNGARALLHRAEDASDEDHIDLDDSWLDAEQKSQGLWKLGVSLLRANRRDGDLPASVARRVELAGLTEELLSNPTPEGSVCKITSHDVVASEAVPGIKALQVLTSPDTTTLYHSISAHAVDSSRPKNTSIAQSLIDMKFAREEEGCTVSTSAISLSAAAEAEDKPTSLDKDSPAGSVFSTQGAGSTSRGSDLTAAPHMDYRIVRGQAMRTRAKDIFGSSILPSTSTTWCRRHRVGSCSVCLMVASTRLNKHRNVPGQGLDVGANGEGAPGKRPLVDVIPRFLSLSAHLLKDARDRVLRQESDRSEEFDSYLAQNEATQVAEVEIAVTAAWFSLLHSFVIQACLEGYLVDGWTGTSAIETLFGCGCGVWEGRGWSARVTTQSATTVVPRPPRSTTAMDVDQGDDDDDDSDDDDEDEEAHLEADREKEKGKLVKAAQLLFGSRDVAQADFERSMRDRIHEFLNVPEERTLKSHLISLSSKYRLSEFENDMYEFLNATIRFLGKPSLAKQYEQSLSSKPVKVADMAPDPWALIPFFARVDSVAPSPAVEDLEASKGKKRRMA